MNISKTPVSILQEMMVKKQTVPNYELVHDGGGTHINTFTYKVTCDGLSATGTGCCKKDAKHEAAKAMLETIAADRGYPQLPASPAQSPVRTPLPATMPASPRIPPHMPFVNAIGALQDLCSENNLQEPEYIPISDIGPPHARVFTIQCVVATFKEEGVGTTKKQAKHGAAKKMLERINDLVADVKTTDLPLTIQSEESRRKEIIANEIAKARYLSLSKLPTKKLNLGLKLSECHVALRNSFDDETRMELIDKLDCCIPLNCNDISEEAVEHLLSKFNEFLSTLNLKVTDTSVNVDGPPWYLVAMQINTCPDIVQIAVGETAVHAKYFTLLKLMKNMKTLLQ